MQVAIRGVKRKMHSGIFMAPLHLENLKEWHAKGTQAPTTAGKSRRWCSRRAVGNTRLERPYIGMRLGELARSCLSPVS